MVNGNGTKTANTTTGNTTSVKTPPVNTKTMCLKYENTARMYIFAAVCSAFMFLLLHILELSGKKMPTTIKIIVLVVFFVVWMGGAYGMRYPLGIK